MLLTDKWDLTLKTLALLGGAIGGVFAFFTYSDTKEKEFYTSYWNTKVALYKDVTEIAGTLATTSSKEEFEKLRARYWALAFGPLTLVESRGVEAKLASFGDLLDRQSVNELPGFTLEPHANDLAGALKDDLIASWRKPFSEFKYSGDGAAPSTLRARKR